MSNIELNRSLTAKFLAGPGNRDIKGIVLHDTAGSGTHNDTRYLASPGDGRNVSVDFTVERDGSIYQLNPDLKKRWCYHAGRATTFRGARNAGVNKIAFGIEIVQKADMKLLPTWPDAQVDAVARLCHYLCQQFNLTKADITTHSAIITDGSRSDPRKWPWTVFWSRFDFWAVTDRSNNAGEATIEPGPIFHTVERGDTLSSLAKIYATTMEKIKALNNMDTPSTVIQLGASLRVK